MYELPTNLMVCGVEYGVRSDYRAVLDICTALSDNDLSGQERSLVALDILYPDFEKMPPDSYREALEQCFWFINCGDSSVPNRKAPKLMDWEQDFQYIVAPINRVVGREIRSAEYLHWWSFISAYYEIGDCLFAQISRIRYKLAKGESLDKEDRKWYNNNRNIVDLKVKYTHEEEMIMKQWGV